MSFLRHQAFLEPLQLQLAPQNRLQPQQPQQALQPQPQQPQSQLQPLQPQPQLQPNNHIYEPEFLKIILYFLTSSKVTEMIN
jgi:hypothetical protein